MKDKNDIPWYKWRFTFAGILWICVSVSLLYSIIKNPSESIWANLIIITPIVFFVYYIAKSEWKFRKSRKLKIMRTR
jgi:membrane protein DedA with SNARE-associated domain